MVGIAAAALLLSGCDNGGYPEVAEGAGPELYREQIREIRPFDQMDDARLDSIATSACDVVATVRDHGGSDLDAMDAVLEVLLQFTDTDADALLAAVWTTGNHCPLDLSEILDEE